MFLNFLHSLPQKWFIQREQKYSVMNIPQMKEKIYQHLTENLLEVHKWLEDGEEFYQTNSSKPSILLNARDIAQTCEKAIDPNRGYEYLTDTDNDDQKWAVFQQCGIELMVAVIDARSALQRKYGIPAPKKNIIQDLIAERKNLREKLDKITKKIKVFDKYDRNKAEYFEAQGEEIKQIFLEGHEKHSKVMKHAIETIWQDFERCTISECDRRDYYRLYWDNRHVIFNYKQPLEFAERMSKRFIDGVYYYNGLSFFSPMRIAVKNHLRSVEQLIVLIQRMFVKYDLPGFLRWTSKGFKKATVTASMRIVTNACGDP